MAGLSRFSSSRACSNVRTVLRRACAPVTHPAALAARTGVYEGDPSAATVVPIMPAWVSLGDYDNIFSYHKLAIKGSVKPSSMGHLAANHDIFAPSTHGYLSGKPRKPDDARACFVKVKVKEIMGVPPALTAREYYQRVHEAEAKSTAAWATAPAEEKASFEAAAAAALAEHETALAAWQEQQKAAQLEMESKFLGQVGKEVNLEEDFGIDSYDKLQSEDGVCMGLRCCLSQRCKIGRSDVHLNQQSLLFEAHVVPTSVVVLPGGNDYAGGEAPGADADTKAPAPLFHLDSSGKACFSAAEAKTASAPPQYTSTAPSGHAIVCLCLAPGCGCNRTTG